MSVNKVIVLGNLGKDPIVRKLDSGKTVVQFSLATSERYKDKAGVQQTVTEWHNIVLWTPLAEIAERYLKKGNQVYIEGRIKSREYTDKEGVNRRITEIEGRELTLLGGPSSGSNSDAPAPSEPTYASKPSDDSIPAPMSGADDDLPF